MIASIFRKTSSTFHMPLIKNTRFSESCCSIFELLSGCPQETLLLVRKKILKNRFVEI